MSNRVTGVLWYCRRSNVGIVQTKSYDGEIKYCIGSPPSMNEYSQELEDAQWIADWGSSFDSIAGDVLFGRIEC